MECTEKPYLTNKDHHLVCDISTKEYYVQTFQQQILCTDYVVTTNNSKLKKKVDCPLMKNITQKLI
jgi:hypothetical protein